MSSSIHSNADPAELAKFADQAHHWWDESSEFGPLHAITPFRLAWIEKQAPLQGKKVLDVGCGGGILAEAMAKAGAKEVLGIDLAEKSIRVAQMHGLESACSGLSYRVVSAEALAEEMPHQFDVVTCMEMMEHVPDPAAIVGACARLIKPGGWVFFSTINRNSMSFLQMIVGAEYVLGMLKKGTHEYARFLRPSELIQWASQEGLKPMRLEGMAYNPLSRRYRWTRNSSVNYFLSCRK